MIPFQIKICGVTRLEDAICVCRSGADAIGLNFFDRSSRHVDTATALKISRMIDQHFVETQMAVKKIGVFVNSSVDSIIAIAIENQLDGIQLHGNETRDTAEAIKRRLCGHNYDCMLIRAIRSNPAPGPAEFARVENEIATWQASGIDSVLLDAAIPGSFGGTGQTLDWNSVPAIRCRFPVTLAGGLVPANVGQAIAAAQVSSVDVASGVESSPGVKDHQKVIEFVRAAKLAFA